jgi:hypothetical protein
LLREVETIKNSGVCGAAASRRRRYAQRERLFTDKSRIASFTFSFVSFVVHRFLL